MLNPHFFPEKDIFPMTKKALGVDGILPISSLQISLFK
jgi:hypothetical protein